MKIARNAILQDGTCLTSDEAEATKSEADYNVRAEKEEERRQRKGNTKRNVRRPNAIIPRCRQK